MIRIAQINLNGLSSKVNVLSDFVKSSKLDIVCITESHLLQHVSDSFVQIPNYILIRNDVAGTVYKHGVCAYVRDNIIIADVSAPLPNLLTFRLVSYDVFVIVVYRPPSNSDIDNQLVCSFLGDFCADKEVILVGDFNLPSLDWCDLNPLSSCPAMEQNFVDLFNSIGLTQWVKQPTYPRSGNILDLVFTSEPDRIGHIEVSAPLPGCDHCPTICDYIFDNRIEIVGSVSPLPNRKAWNRGRYALMRQSLRSLDWDLELAHLDCDESFNHFATIVSDLIDLYVPVQPTNNGKPPWQTRPPTSLMHRRQVAWQSYKNVRHNLGRKSPGALTSYNAYASVNKEVRNFAVRSQSEYESSLIERSRDNPKLLHSYIRNKKVGRPTVGPLLLQTGDLSDDSATMAELFASSFASVFTVNTPTNPAPHQVFDGSLSQVEITADVIHSALRDLDPNSAMGPDRMHPRVLQTCADELAYPLHVIFSRSLREGRLPSYWKSSLVSPIFKKGPRYDPLNYRPISLTSMWLINYGTYSMWYSSKLPRNELNLD